jgi:hypothetical protein
MDQAEQDVLGPDVVVVEQSRFFLRENNDSSCSVREALEQDDLPLQRILAVPILSAVPAASLAT